MSELEKALQQEIEQKKIVSENEAKIKEAQIFINKIEKCFK